MTKQQIYDRHNALLAKVDDEHDRIVRAVSCNDMDSFWSTWERAQNKFRADFAALAKDCAASGGHVRNYYGSCLLCGHNPVQDEEQTARNLTVG
jgi:hypothetical protein